MGRLEGKIAIVTGGARGMGAAHTRLLHSEGARVICTDILRDDGQRLVQELGAGVVFADHDVSQLAQWERVVSHAEAEFGAINILVNNAGISAAESIETCSVRSYMRIIEVNQLGVFLGMKTVLPSMRRAGGGSIINISSVGGLVGGPNSIGYCDSKFALRGMSKVAAIEFGCYGIRVNTVHPGAVKTPMLMERPDATDILRRFGESTPLGRVADPEEISRLVLFLASDDSSYSTGAEFIADGGATCQ